MSQDLAELAGLVLAPHSGWLKLGVDHGIKALLGVTVSLSLMEEMSKMKKKIALP